jgi:hypothetical protein
VALLGPLATGVIEYHTSQTLRNQTIGLDATSLFVVAPLSVVAATLVLRHHAVGPALALGIGAYTSYMFVQYILGPDYANLPGNNERIFPLWLALFGEGWMVGLAAWSALDVGGLPASPRRDRILARVVLPIVGLLAFSRYALASRGLDDRPPDG